MCSIDVICDLISKCDAFHFKTANIAFLIKIKDWKKIVIKIT